jgi:hypothetical protein
MSGLTEALSESDKMLRIGLCGASGKKSKYRDRLLLSCHKGPPITAPPTSATTSQCSFDHLAGTGGHCDSQLDLCGLHHGHITRMPVSALPVR